MRKTNKVLDENDKCILFLELQRSSNATEKCLHEKTIISPVKLYGVDYTKRVLCCRKDTMNVSV